MRDIAIDIVYTTDEPRKFTGYVYLTKENSKIAMEYMKKIYSDETLIRTLILRHFNILETKGRYIDIERDVHDSIVPLLYKTKIEIEPAGYYLVPLHTDYRHDIHYRNIRIPIFENEKGEVAYYKEL